MSEFKNTIRFRTDIFGKLVLQMLCADALNPGHIPYWRDATVKDLRLIYNNPKLKVGADL